MPSDSVAFRLLLTMVSIVAYAVLVQIRRCSRAIEGVPNMNTVFHLVVGAVFGAFVLAPYAGASRRVLRGIALAVAAAAIYYAAVRFVVNRRPGSMRSRRSCSRAPARRSCAASQSR